MPKEFGTEIRKMMLRVRMNEDGSKWDVPVEVIARDRAEYYRNRGEFKTLDESLEQGTWPLFERDSFEVEDWAANNMNWDEVQDIAVRVKLADIPDYFDGWCNGEKEIVKPGAPA